MPKEVIDVNWYASKEPLSVFVRLLYNHAFSSVNRDRLYRETPSGYFPLDGFIYDLGHNGRGFDEFPKVVRIEVPDLKEIAGAELEVDMPVADFVTQIKSQIEDFVMAHEFAQARPQSYEATMKVFDILAREAGDQKVKIIFGTNFDRTRKINSLDLAH